MQFENGNGFDNTGTGSGYINLAYVTWAGITAGKAPSFFSFTGGGAGWANFFSPDQQGFNQPDLLAYTASFGGGFSATISLQDPILGGASGPGVDTTLSSATRPIRACARPTSSARSSSRRAGAPPRCRASRTT